MLQPAPSTEIKNHQGRIVHQEPTGQVRLVEFERRPFEVMGEHFGPRFSRYREAWAASSKFAYLPDFPLSLDLEVNASCNLCCVMCVMGARSAQPNAEQPLMNRSLYRRIMGEAEKMKLPAMTFGFLSEPLLAPDLPEMIRLAREAGVMDIRVGTNATLLTPDLSRRFIEAGLTRLEVSLDAFRPETYRRIRRGADLDAVIKNVLGFLDIRAGADSDFPILRLSFLRLPYNEDELDAFLDYWRDKADLFSIQEPIYFEDAPLAREMDLIRGPVPPSFRCAQPWQRVVIRTNGDVYPCCSIYGLAMPMGSAQKADIIDLWNEQLMIDLRRLHHEGRYQKNPHCLKCAERSALKAAPRGSRIKKERK